MHQSHNIPWSIVSTRLKITQENPNLQGRHGTKIFYTAVSTRSRCPPSEYADAMNHFKRKLVQSLSDFSATERAEYPETLKPVSKGKFLSDEFFHGDVTSPQDEYPELDGPVNREPQKIESWLEMVPKGLNIHEAYGRLEDFADAIKVLLSVEDNFDLSVLLMLAGHPSCNLAALHSFGQSFDSGWGQAIDVALEMYLFINIIGNTPALLEDSQYARMKDFQNLVVHQI